MVLEGERRGGPEGWFEVLRQNKEKTKGEGRRASIFNVLACVISTSQPLTRSHQPRHNSLPSYRVALSSRSS